MSENNLTNVQAAFEILLEEIEAEIDLINTIGSRAFDNRDYESARKALDQAGQATGLRDDVIALRKKWDAFAIVQQPSRDEETIRAERRNLGRLQRGLRTSEATYNRPILQALSELGGSARINDVLTKVEQLMKGTLKEVDFELLSSNNTPRWRITARWARNTMVDEGLLKKGSPHGLWEITEAGRAALLKKL